MGYPRDARFALRRRVLPSWLISVAIHVALVILLALSLRGVPRGAAEEPGRTAGIVLKHTSAEGELYEGEEDALEPAEVKTAADESQQHDALLAALPDAQSAGDLSSHLPAPPAIGPAPRPDGGIGDASSATSGARQPRVSAGGRARVRIFGVEGEGNKFVYLFDRSVSMEGPRLASAKAQLLASLDALQSTHQFQIIFFNHALSIFDLTGGQRRIAFATDQNKQLARKFVGGITADGGTDRAAALRHAVALRPDVIFFLTDEDNPLTASQLDRIRRVNRGSAIHVIEFGFGPASGRVNFLVRLAQQNQGKHIYVDTSKLAR